MTPLLLLYNLRSVRARWRVTALAVSAIALVVAVAGVVLAMAEGFATALRSTGRGDNAIIVQRGSPSELMSHVLLEQRARILADDRIARRAGGEALASWEQVQVLSLERRLDGRRTNVILRGVPPSAFEVRGRIRLLAGRRFLPGRSEVIVGRRIRGRLRGLDPGERLRFRGLALEVVGVFESEGAAFESEIWGDFDTLASLYRTGPDSNSLVVRMKDAARIPELDRWLRAQPAMQLRAESERKYYADQAGPIVRPLRALAALVTLIMGSGAVFGVMNTMYALVAARTREIGTLRALGFSRGSILASFVLESALLAAVGGVAGGLLALSFQNHASSTANLQSLSVVAFAFRITPQILLAGLALALALGVLGGMLPALRAARMPIAEAMRAA